MICSPLRYNAYMPQFLIIFNRPESINPCQPLMYLTCVCDRERAVRSRIRRRPRETRPERRDRTRYSNTSVRLRRRCSSNATHRVCVCSAESAQTISVFLLQRGAERRRTSATGTSSTHDIHDSGDYSPAN